MNKRESRIVFYAFRYCLGRMTYAVSDFCEYVLVRIKKIAREELELMNKEITEAQEYDDNHQNVACRCSLGMICDRQDWLNLRAAIRGELKRREGGE